MSRIYRRVLILKRRTRVLLGSLSQSSAGQVENVLQTTKRNREDYGVDKYWVLLAVEKE